MNRPASAAPERQTLDQLVRAGSLLAGEMDFGSLASILVEQALDVSRSDLAALYVCADPEDRRSDLRLFYRRGRYDVADRLPGRDPFVEFARECDEAVVLLERRGGPLDAVLLDPSMSSGIAVPISTPRATIGLLVLNSLEPLHYDRSRFHFLDSYSKLASGMLHNSRLFQDLKETLARVQGLERYQEGIFASMTNLLLVTDESGRLHYFNPSAAERLGLGESDLGKPLPEVMGGSVDRKLLRALERCVRDGTELLGTEGIYKLPDREIDFALTASPLKGPRGRLEGMTLLITDQTRERELAGQVEQVTEERRLIKDMFSRYLSVEVVAHLVESPQLVRLGGDKKEATIFFADIRGYTSFSEGKDPEYIIEVLNQYFSEAVEVVIRHRGYIDKFIGDAIMAAWGVPLQSVADDARQAVTAALEIQRMVGSRDRKFFHQSASRLKIGIGMHTGPIVAGNLGSARRMNYTVIGDTVNVAARLEGVAGPDEVIITEETRQHLGEDFVVEARKPVSVKGKSEPLRIYRVLRKAS